MLTAKIKTFIDEYFAFIVYLMFLSFIIMMVTRMVINKQEDEPSVVITPPAVNPNVQKVPSIQRVIKLEELPLETI